MRHHFQRIERDVAELAGETERAGRALLLRDALDLVAYGVVDRDPAAHLHGQAAVVGEVGVANAVNLFIALNFRRLSVFCPDLNQTWHREKMLTLLRARSILLSRDGVLVWTAKCMG